MSEPAFLSEVQRRRSAPASPRAPERTRHRLRRRARLAWAVVSIFVVESLVFGLAALPAVLFWRLHFAWSFPAEWLRIVVLSMTFIPAYLLFATALMVLTALATRITGWRAPRDAAMPIRDLEWPLLDWGRYMVANHLVRTFAGSVLRATPLWSFFLRLNGARVGRGVWVNSLLVHDHNLLEFGDHVVIGAHAHLSGHTVEHGVVKTAPVRLGDNVTIGVESVIGIGVEIGPDTQIGALSLVPKHSTLAGGATYVGIPVRRLTGAEGAGLAPES